MRLVYLLNMLSSLNKDIIISPRACAVAGFESHVGREFSQSLGALVSASVLPMVRLYIS